MESKKYCQYCGTALNPDAQFCSRCGKAVQEQENAPTVYLGKAQMPVPEEEKESTQPIRTVKQPDVPPPPPPPMASPAQVSFSGTPTAPPPAYQRQPSSPVVYGGGVPQQTYPQAVTPKPRKKRGCLWGCLLTIVAIAVIIGGIFAWMHFFPAWSVNLTTGDEQRIDKLNVAKSGGTATVDNPDSVLDGMTIEVPEGAYDQRMGFTISERPIETHDLHPAFNPVTPLIHVDNGGKPSAEPLLVTIPVQIAPDEFAMAFYYDPVEGVLEGLPLVDMTDNSVTVATTHFSWLTVSLIKKSVLESIAVDTGFQPGVDDWQFVNYGSYISPGGHCAGQSISAMWYYYEQKLGKGEPSLWARFDNNDQPGTSAFQDDDSWSYRFASVVQSKLIDWDHISRSFFKAMGGTSDYLTWASFVYSMYITEEPQYVGIYSGSGGHAIIAYKVENGLIYVADPNYPGKTGRYLRFEQDKFQPYYSGANATAIQEEGETAYTSIRYFSKSAMVNWDAIGDEYKKMLKGTSGDDAFLAYEVYYLSDINETTGDAVWTKMPDVLELTEDDTAEPDEQYRGKLIVRVDVPDGTKFQARLYNGTEKITGGSRADNSTEVFLEMPLKPGVYNLGVQTQAIVQSGIQYNDFIRIKLAYERDDLTGTWAGYWRVVDAQKIIRFIVEWLAKFVYQAGFTETYEEAEAAIWQAVEEDPYLYSDRPIQMVFTPVDADKRDKYDVVITTWDEEGAPTEYRGDAVYREGELELKWRPDAGSKLIMQGEFGGENTLYGTFSINAWGIIKDAITGSWEIQRTDQ